MQINLYSPKCEACDLFASYGLPGERPRFCATHRTEGMVGAWPLHSCCACRACKLQAPHAACHAKRMPCLGVFVRKATLRFAGQAGAVLQ